MRRVLLVLAVLLASYGCEGGQTQAPNQQEKEPAPQQTAEPTEPENAAVVGRAVPFPDFDLRVLDVIVADAYQYADFINPDGSPSNPEVVPAAGKFLIVSYSARNTTGGPLQFGTGATLTTAEGQTYETSEEAEHPDSGDFGFELAPDQMSVGMFIFDVPTDAEPGSISVGEGYQGNFDAPPVGIDLTEGEPRGPEPDEILALQYEYANMAAWDEAYALYADESKALVSEEQFTEVQAGGPQPAISEYAFPSVEVNGDSASIHRVLTVNSAEGDAQDEATQEMALQEDGWRVVMRDDQVETFLGG